MKIDNLSTCSVWSVLKFFLMIKMFVRRKFTSRLLKCTVKVHWTKEMWGDGIGCSEKARQCAAARCRTYTLFTRNSWSCKYPSIIRTVPTLHRVFVICFYTTRNCWSAGVRGVTCWAEDVLKDRLKGVTVTLFDEGIQKLVSRYDKYLNWHGNYVKM